MPIIHLEVTQDEVTYLLDALMEMLIQISSDEQSRRRSPCLSIGYGSPLTCLKN